MADPTSNLDWTIGNTNFGTVTVEPTTGKKQTGWTPGEPPPAEYLNWLFYNTDQWIKALKSARDSQAALIATIQSSLFSTNMVQEIPSGTADGTNALFTLTQAPSSPGNLFLFGNSLLIPRSEYSLTGKNITFNGGSAPPPGTDIEAIYVIQTGFSGQTVSSGGGITPKVENRTLSSTDISNGQIILAAAPFDGTATLVDVIEDGPQYYGGDFTITGNVLSWAGLGMAGAVSAGVTVRIQYFI